MAGPFLVIIHIPAIEMLMNETVPVSGPHHLDLIKRSIRDSLYLYSHHLPGSVRDGYMRLLRSKLMYRVAFPFELKLGAAASAGCPAADAPYALLAVIVHVGSGLDHGAM